MWLYTLTILFTLVYSINAYKQLLASSNACFSATQRTSSNIFNAPQAGIIEGIKLVHNSGLVSCVVGQSSTKWGCLFNGCIGLPCADINVILFHVTDNVNKYGEEYYPVDQQTENLTLYRSFQSVGWGAIATAVPGSPTTFGYRMSNQDYNSAELTLINPQYPVTMEDQFMLQYSEAYINADDDNAGQSCAEVYFLYQEDCEESNMIKHINWNALLNGENNTKSMEQVPESIINVNFDRNTLTTTIDIEVEYLGTSYAEFDYEIIQLGTTIVIDFETFDENSDSIDKPGTCANRVYESFTDINQTRWWSYSNSPYVENQLGVNEFLAYPPPSNYWSIGISNICGPIVYSGTFSWTDLTQSCVDFDGNNLVTVVDSNNKLLLLGTVYVNVISPYINTNDNQHYRKYQLSQQDFNIEVDKTINVMSSTNSELFVMTVTGVGINREDSNDNNDKLEITLFTESADYLVLTDAVLLSSPLSNINHDINLIASDDQCLSASRSYTCGQRWKVQIGDYSDQCPFDFSGLYTLQFNAKCNNDSNANNTSVCAAFFDDNDGNNVVLSTKLNFIDETCDDKVWNVSFTGNTTFYTDDTFTHKQTNSYTIGQAIYVEITAQFADGSQYELYDVFRVDITNVYVCTSDPDNVIDSCLQNGIDADGPYMIINNQIPNNYYAAGIVTHNVSNIARFAFDAFDVGRETMYVHAQLTITLQTTEGIRRLLQTSSSVTTQMRDFMAYTSVVDDIIQHSHNATKYNEDNTDNAYSMIHHTSTCILFSMWSTLLSRILI